MFFTIVNTFFDIFSILFQDFLDFYTHFLYNLIRKGDYMTTLGERIKESREKLGMSQAELANAIKIKASSGVISNWERDLNKPDAEKIIKLCKILKVSASYLLDYYGSTGFETTLSEQLHIKKYRQLDTYGKKAVEQLTDNEYTRVKEQTAQAEERERLYEISEDSAPYLYGKTEYLTGLSAGTGLFVFDDIPTQVIQVPAKYKDADFVIGVSGDSMEPTYYSGDKVAVIKTTRIEVGEIGVFMVDGNGYIKELGDGALISHNEAYPDVDLTDNTVCVGKVLGKV